jgi:hypothetical protein
MAGVEETLVAATAVLQSLARDETTRGSVYPPFDFDFPATNGAKTSKFPGIPSPAKVAFEAELEALMRRVHHLEFQAVSLHKLPDNPQQTTLSAIGANEKDPDFFVDRRARSLPVKVLTLLFVLNSSKNRINPTGNSGPGRALKKISLIHPNYPPRLETLTKTTPTRRMKPVQRVRCAKKTSASSAIMCKSKPRKSASRKIS